MSERLTGRGGGPAFAGLRRGIVAPTNFAYTGPIAVFVEVFGEVASRARKADEVIHFVRIRFDEEILFLRGVALEAQALRDLLAFARIVDEHRESKRLELHTKLGSIRK